MRLNSVLRVEQKRQTLASTLDSVPNEAGRWFSLGARAERNFIQELETIRGKVGLSRNQISGNTETRLAMNWQREDRNPEGGCTRSIKLWRWMGICATVPWIIPFFHGMAA